MLAEQGLDFGVMARPRPLAEVAKALGLSERTLWRYVEDRGITKYRMPGQGKRTYLDLDEARRKLKPRPVQSPESSEGD